MADKASYETSNVVTANEEKGFGFLKDPKAPDAAKGRRINLFFHATGYRQVVLRDGEVTFETVGRHERRMPQLGETVMFVRGVGDDGRPQCDFWFFAADYEAATGQVAAKDKYKVVMTISKRVAGKGADNAWVVIDTSCVWEGEGVDTLAEEFPITIMGGQVVDPIWGFEDGYVTVSYSFYVWDPSNGDQIDGWCVCDDPRPEPTPTSARLQLAPAMNA